MWELRNSATHVNDVLTNIGVQAFTTAAGKTGTHAWIGIDANAVLGADNRLDESLRTDLATLTEPLDVRTIVARTMDSALSVHARFLKGLQGELDPVIDVILGLHSEVVAVGGTFSLVGTAVPGDQPGQLICSQSQNPWQQAQALREQFAQFTDVLIRGLRWQLTALQAAAESAKTVKLAE